MTMTDASGRDDRFRRAAPMSRIATVATVVAVAGPIGVVGAWAPPQASGQPISTLTVSPVLSGTSLSHTFTKTGTPTAEPLTKPDDLTQLGGDLFVNFQNGVGPQGQPSSTGNPDSTIVEFTPRGHEVSQWDITGRSDGLSADPALHALIATVNEDGDSSLYVIELANPTATSAGGVLHFRYSTLPLPHNGGTDAISIVGDQVLISASAPGTPSTANPTPPPAPTPAYPAVYSVHLDPV